MFKQIEVTDHHLYSKWKKKCESLIYLELYVSWKTIRLKLGELKTKITDFIHREGQREFMYDNTLKCPLGGIMENV